MFQVKMLCRAGVFLCLNAINECMCDMVAKKGGELHHLWIKGISYVYVIARYFLSLMDIL